MTTINITNVPALEVNAALYRGDDIAIRLHLTQDGLPLTPAIRAALADQRVVWAAACRQRADASILFTAASVTFDSAADTVLIDLTGGNTALLTPSAAADLQVSWPDASGRVRRRTLATFSISTTRDVTP